MKCFFAFISLLLGVAISSGEESLLRSEEGSVIERRADVMGTKLERFVTMKGRVYDEVKITEINDAGISFTHSAGAARLRYEDLSPEQRRFFGITEEAAAEIYRREQAARLAYEDQVEEREAERNKAAKEETEARWLLAEKAAKARPERAVGNVFVNQEESGDTPSWVIPSMPDLIPMEPRRSSRVRHSRVSSYHFYPGYHPASFPYGYYQGGYRYGGHHHYKQRSHCHRPIWNFTIRR